VLGAPVTATLTLDDDDPAGQIDFKSLHYDVDETDGQATVTVHRTGGVGGAVSVDYATSDGTATEGSDYDAASGTLNWAAGDSADKTFTVPVTWDGRAEGPEALNLELTNPGGGSDLGPNNVAVLRIGDDGASGPLVLTSTSYSVGEADAVATVTVTRSGGSLGGPVTVDYATSDGTATAGSDYETASGTLTFGPGEASKSFTVPVTSDSTHEGDETFQVTLSNAGGGASLGSPAGATVTITDDDAGDPPATPATPPSGGDPPVFTPSGTVTLGLSLRARKAQRLRPRRARLTLTATCSSDCTLRVGGKIKLSRARLSSLTTREARAKTLKLRAKTFKLTAGTRKSLRLTISRRLARQILAGLKQGRRVSAALKGTATNPSATPGIRNVSIRLKR
jgi:hypothetical protein